MDNTNYNKLSILEIILIFASFGTLTASSSLYISYLLVFLFAILTTYTNSKLDNKYLLSKNKKENLVIIFFAIVFSIIVLLSNYDIFVIKPYINLTNSLFVYTYNLITFLCISIGTFIGFYNILFYLKNNSDKIVFNESIKQAPFFIFIISFVLIVTVNMIILYNAFYPGLLTQDSLLQIDQAMSGNYNNHHPYYHTIIIKFFIEMGINLFNDINKGVFLYCAFQTMLLASAFSLSFSTLDKIKVNRKYIYTMLFLTIIMPYNIFFSFTVWKDVVFACTVLYFLIFLYRNVAYIGNSKINTIMLILSSLAFCLFRSNGFFAYILSVLFFIILLGKNNKKIVLLMVLTIALSYCLKGPFLEQKKISPPDTIESLSIPSQQIARVVVEGGKMSSKEKHMINKIIDINIIPKIYLPYLSDPVKNKARERNKQEFIKYHKLEYLKLYVDLGIKNPVTYVKAWVDQTKGYWNSGYDYWYYTDIIFENKFNIKKSANNKLLFSSMKSYAELFAEHPLLRIFVSIGAAFWSILLMLFISICKKRKLESFLTIPIIMIVASLLIATPVAYEFRYAYSIFVAIPFILGVSLRKDYIIENKNK